METFSFGDPEAIDTAVSNAENLPNGTYPMELNTADLATVLHALHNMALSENVDKADYERASALLSDILQTLDVEYV